MFQQSKSTLTIDSFNKLRIDGLFRAVTPAPSIDKPRTRIPAFNAVAWIAKNPITRLIEPQTIPRMAAWRIVLRVQTTRRAWFSVESNTGSCNMIAIFSSLRADNKRHNATRADLLTAMLQGFARQGIAARFQGTAQWLRRMQLSVWKVRSLPEMRANEFQRPESGKSPLKR